MSPHLAGSASPAMKETCDGTGTEAIDVSTNAFDSMLFSCESD
jgi:hypothetical protein